VLNFDFKDGRPVYGVYTEVGKPYVNPYVFGPIKGSYTEIGDSSGSVRNFSQLQKTPSPLS